MPADAVPPQPGGETDGAAPRKVFIHTFGCQMNVYDSQKMRDQLAEHAWQPAASAEEADLVLVNTCAIRENAENRVYSLLGRLRELKKERPQLRIGVAGCVAQQRGEEILRRERAVDLVFGPDTADALPQLLRQVAQGARVVRTEWRPPTKGYVDNFVPQAAPAPQDTLQVSAPLAITKGCNNHCAFCVVPLTRGKEFSRTPADLLAEARRLIARGVKEITLLGQNVNSYRAGPVRFVQLLEAFNQLEGLERIRYTSPHPKDFSPALAQAHARLPRLCEHLHLPVQSGSSRILERMGRRHTRQDYLDKITLARKHCPALALSTDLIVGFPGETEAEFAETLSLLETVRFDHLYAFKYSPRSGTPAASFPGQLPAAVKAGRLARLLELQQRLQAQSRQALLGSRQQVLVEGPHPAGMQALLGRTRGHHSVIVVDCEAGPGTLLEVEITALRKRALVATVR